MLWLWLAGWGVRQPRYMGRMGQVKKLMSLLMQVLQAPAVVCRTWPSATYSTTGTPISCLLVLCMCFMAMWQNRAVLALLSTEA